MDFFKHQGRARKFTFVLIFLLILALVGVFIAVYVLITVLFFLFSYDEIRHTFPESTPLNDWRLIVFYSSVILLFIGGVSLYRIGSLSGGGHVVASSLGGNPLRRDTQDFDERRLLNVVEEMAIASGIPVPPVYLLEEKGINAFAAGYSPQDAVIGVTRGCIETLTRDELQAVIAHEFSHIFNGDMRLNINLIGVVYGIMAIGLIGAQAARLNGERTSFISMIGFCFICIGAVGTFFGNLIKASVSRQREYLADASAVQFTRNPLGMTGALKQIGASPTHGIISNSSAAEYSHMYFAKGVSGFLSGLFSTHPQLEKRIKRIEPNWDGKFPKYRQSRKLPKQPASTAKEKADQMRQKIGKTIPILMGVESIGKPNQHHLDLASKLIAEIPESIKEAARNPYGARAVLYALLLNHEANVQRTQLYQLNQFAEKDLAEMTSAVAEKISKLDRKHRLPLAEMTLGSLKLLTPTQYKHFMANLEVLINADNKIDMFEWVVLRIVKKHLGPPYTQQPKYHRLEKLNGYISYLISTLAWVGQRDPVEVKKAFAAGADTVGIAEMTLVSKKHIGLSKLGQVLDKLDLFDMNCKKKLIAACANCIVADDKVTDKESELMRAISESFGCPMPPLDYGAANN